MHPGRGPQVGTSDVTGSGLESIPYLDKSFTKSGQEVGLFVIPCLTTDMVCDDSG